MDDSLKKRLIGAVVLVSLAVIFVPMLVEDEPVVSGHITETNIPPRPEFPTVEPQASAAGEAAEAGSGERGYALPLPEPSGAPQTAAAPEIAPPPPPPEVADEPLETASPRAETTPPAEQPAPAPEPQPQAKPAGSEGWVVQVGSFSDKGNANSVTERLRSAGFSVFQEDIRVGDKVLYRVRVGPEAAREQAEKLQAKIADMLKLNGQVRRHP